MRLLYYLQEDYLTIVKGVVGKMMFQPGVLGTGDSTAVFVNPSAKELGEFKLIRFFVSFKKKVIVVWNADIIHPDVFDNKDVQKILGVKNGDFDGSMPYIFSGIGKIKGGKIVDVISDGMDSYADCEYYYKKVKDDWTKQWFGSNLSDILLKLIEEL